MAAACSAASSPRGSVCSRCSNSSASSSANFSGEISPPIGHKSRAAKDSRVGSTPPHPPRHRATTAAHSGRQNLARHKTKTHAMAVAEKTGFNRQTRANGSKRLVIAGRRDTIGLGEQRILQIGIASAPFGDFEARPKLRIGIVNRMRKHRGKKRCAPGTFHKLSRTRQQTKNDARQGRIRNIARRDVNEKFRSAPKVTRDANRFDLSPDTRHPPHQWHHPVPVPAAHVYFQL